MAQSATRRDVKERNDLPNVCNNSNHIRGHCCQFRFLSENDTGRNHWNDLRAEENSVQNKSQEVSSETESTGCSSHHLLRKSCPVARDLKSSTYLASQKEHLVVIWVRCLSILTWRTYQSLTDSFKLECKTVTQTITGKSKPYKFQIEM